MKNFSSFLIFLMFAWLGIWWYYSCSWCLGGNETSQPLIENKNNPDSDALKQRVKAYEDSIAAIKNKNAGLFAIDLKGYDVFRYIENFRINNTNGDVFIPNSIDNFSDQIALYLGQHQDQELIVYGYENFSERKESNGLGLARANFIKDILIASGVNGDRIVTESKLENYYYDENTGYYIGGILFKFNELDASRIAEIEEGVANKTLYSAFAQKTFTPDATLTNYVLELKNYLEKYPDKIVEIIGHTDDVGDAEANLWFGQERANNVMNYLISQGIAKDKIKATSQGESSPIVPNDSEENKAKNRRIEIIIN